MHKQRFLVDTAGTLCLPLRVGEAPINGDVSITLYSPDGSELQAATTATKSTINTTIATSAVSEGEVTFTAPSISLTGLSVGKWVIVGTLGSDPQELMRIKRVASTTITVHEPFRYDHAIGQTVVGAEATYALTTTHTDTLDRNYRALWSYVDTSGKTIRTTQIFDVVAAIFKLPPLDLSVYISEDVRRSADELFSQEELAKAAEEHIIRDLERRRLYADRIMHPDQFHDLGVFWCAAILYNRAKGHDPAFRQAWKDAVADYESEFAGLLEARLDWYDADEDLAVDSADEYGIGEEESVGAPRYMEIG